MTEHYLAPSSDPPSDPEGAPPPKLDDDTTKSIVTRLERSAQREYGARNAWRVVAGVLLTVGLTAGGAFAATSYGLAQQQAVDHERIDRLETDVRAMREDLDAIRSALARIEGRLERRED